MSTFLSGIVNILRGSVRGKRSTAKQFVLELLESRQLLDAAPAPLAAPAPPAPPPMDAVLNAGTVAPQFSLPYAALPGMYNLYQDASQAVVVTFFQTTNLMAAQTLPQVQTVYDWVQNNGYSATILGIDEQENAVTVQQYWQSQSLSFPAAMDAAGNVAALYNVASVPVTYVIAARHIQYVHAGYSDTLATDLENEIRGIAGLPNMSIDNVTVSEGLKTDVPATFTVTLSNVSMQQVKVDYMTVDGTAMAGRDYRATTGTLTFDPGETTKTITVQVIGNGVAEPSPTTFAVQLYNVNNALLEADTGICTIIDADSPAPPAVVYINNFTGVEPSNGTTTFDVVVSLAQAVPIDVTVDYASRDGTGANAALAGTDYVATSGTLTIPANSSFATIPVTILNTPTDDRDKTFTISLGNPVGGKLLKIPDTATVTIRDNHRSISVDNVTVDENSPTPGIFKIMLSTAAAFPVSVEYYTVDGTAITNLDYYGVGGTATFSPGQTEIDIPVQPIADTIPEQNKIFYLRLRNSRNAPIAVPEAQGTIMDAGGTDPATPTFTVIGGSVVEGDFGQSTTSFTIKLSSVQVIPVAVDYTTADDTGSATAAIAGEDYLTTSGTVMFAPGETAKTIMVPLIGDLVNEANEHFLVNLSNPQESVIGTGTATITIVDNDPETISSSSKVMYEGTGFPTQMDYTVTLSRPSEQTITVRYGTADATATTGTDYQAVSGTLTFAPGTTTQAISVPIVADTTPEADRYFAVNLSNASVGTIATPMLTGTILDDDRTPIIKVTLGKSEIPNGQLQPPVDFGTVWRNDKEPTRTFRITNVGTDVLRLGGIVTPPGFKLVTRPRQVLAIGASSTFSIKLQTKWLHSYAGHVRFASNQMGNKPFRFGVMGAVVKPGTKLKRTRSGATRAAASAVSAPVAAKAAASSVFASDSKKTIRRNDWLF